VKNVVQLAIDAAEAAIVFGARVVDSVTGLTASDRQDVAVDKLWDDTKRGVYIENLHTHTESTTEASPEADAGQPLASVATRLTADDLESAAFACRKYAEMAVFGAAQLHWRGIADRIDYSAAIARQLEAANE
jgi:hypothetical protein